MFRTVLNIVMSMKSGKQEKFTVNIHDVFSPGLLRLVSPEELIASLQTKLPARKIKNFGCGAGEDRVDYCWFSVDGYKIYYQVCGLFSGDEYFDFPKNTSKRVIDEVLAVWVQNAAFTLGTHLKSEQVIQVGESKIKVLTPEEVLVEGDLKKKEAYSKKRQMQIQRAFNEASAVLTGKKSYFDAKLKNYQKRPDLGEALIKMVERATKIDDVVNCELKNEDEPFKFLVTEYLKWKTKLTGFETLYRTFRAKIEGKYRGLSTSPQRGWGPLSEEQNKQVVYLKAAVDDAALIKKAIEMGEKLLPKIETNKK